MTMRNLARVSAAGLLAAGAFALTATPALAAADVDFGLELKGSSIALGAGGKFATANIVNHGTTTPKYVNVLFDASKLDTSKVELDLGDCKVQDGIADCALDEDQIPGPGKTAETSVPLKLKGVQTKPVSLGKLTVTVLVEGDTNKANDSKTVDVKVTAFGADLRVLAFDVSQVDGDGNLTGKPVQPGATSVAYGFVANQGSATSLGFKVKVSLPKLVTFAEKEDGCAYSSDNRIATCTAEDYPLVPWDQDSSKDKELSTLSFGFAVTVSKDAKGPVSLPGGSFTGSALSVAQNNDRTLSRRAAPSAAAKPAFALRPPLPDNIEAQLETDASDNTDGFAVLVAGPAAGSGGGTGTDTDGPSLPVTGPVAASVAGAGVLVLALGTVLFVSSRRRRVVLVTPTDGQ